MSSTLITEANSRIELINGAKFSQVFWQVGTTATLGDKSTFTGSILANNSISAGTGATIKGRLSAITGGITLNSNQIDAIEILPVPGEPVGVVPPDKVPPVTTETVPAIEAPDKVNPGVTAKSDPITLYRAGDTYAATIEWGEMTFNYNLGTWDPEFHSWVGGGWDDENFNGVNDKITVTNGSTQPITATFGYTPDETNGGKTTGAFTEEPRNLNAPKEIMVLANGSSDNTYLNLQGVPFVGSTPTKIGSISVTLNSVSP